MLRLVVFRQGACLRASRSHKARAAARWRTALAVQQHIGAAFAAGASGAAHPPRGAGSRGRRARAKAAAAAADARRAAFEGDARARACRERAGDGPRGALGWEGTRPFVACSVVYCGGAPRQRGGVLGWLGFG